MTLHFTLGLDSALIRGRPDWLPAALFGAGTGGAWHDPGRGLFQDIAGTLPVSAPGQTVALMRDLSGSGRDATQATAAARPVFGRHPPRGRVNRLPNNGTEGAVLGVIGAGGALPTGWSLSFAGGAAGTGEIVAITDAYVDIEIAQTQGTGAPILTLPAPTAGYLPTAPGDDWAFGVGLALVAGSLGGNGTPQLRGTQRDGAGGSLASLTFNDTLSLSGTLARYSGTDAIGHASAAQMNADFRVASAGAWTATFRISRPQLERGTVATALQYTRAGGFDVTEGGQQDVCYLALDGVDDWMALASAFAPAGAYTLAAVRGFDSLAALNNDPGVSFGRSGNTAAYLTRQSAATMHLRINTSANNLTSSGGFVPADDMLRTVEMVRVAGAATGQMWRNAVAANAVVVTGSLTPLASLDTLGNRGGGFGAGRFYGGVLIDRTITEPERLALQAYLAARGGIAL